MDHSNVVGLVANTVAHEMGHNLGMEHDTDDCECPSDRCIMSPSSRCVDLGITAGVDRQAGTLGKIPVDI